MIPMYFGRSDVPLYGVYHAPSGTDRKQGVLLCYPFGQEYLRAHRAYRQIATQLTDLGFHVFRFDYRGTGDSAGGMTGVSGEDWVDDIDQALDELRDTAGVSSFSVMGLRLGALFCTITCERRKDIKRLILWDPVSSIDEYETELLTEISAEESRSPSVSLGNDGSRDSDIHYNGFTLPLEFRDSTKAFDLRKAVPHSVGKILHVFSHETESFRQLREAWAAHENYSFQHEEAPHDWTSVDAFGGILLPQPVLKVIVAWLDDTGFGRAR